MDNLLETLTNYNFSMLEDRIEFDMDGVIEKEIAPAYCSENFELCIACMDYTSLKITDTENTISLFISDLLKKITKNSIPNVASVCTFPQYASLVKSKLTENPIKVSIVGASFPFAQSFTQIKLAECEAAVNAGADEVDVVLSVGDILEKNYVKVFEELSAIREACKGITLKVILETGELKDLESIFNATLISAYAGADFIKTSTGKVPVNATPESVYIICEAIRQFHQKTGKMVGVKVSGGITKTQNAIRYMIIVRHILGKGWLTPSHFRLGASQLLDDIIKELTK